MDLHRIFESILSKLILKHILEGIVVPEVRTIKGTLPPQNGAGAVGIYGSCMSNQRFWFTV